MNDENKTIPMPPQMSQQQAPRMPDVDTAVFAILNEIDGFLGKAALTRIEHAQCNQAMQNLLRMLEAEKHAKVKLEAEVTKLRDALGAANQKLERANNANTASTMVAEVLNETPTPRK